MRAFRFGCQFPASIVATSPFCNSAAVQRAGVACFLAGLRSVLSAATLLPSLTRHYWIGTSLDQPHFESLDPNQPIRNCFSNATIFDSSWPSILLCSVINNMVSKPRAHIHYDCSVIALSRYPHHQASHVPSGQILIAFVSCE